MIPRLRALALPPEHGGWGFLLEALLLGLVAAPSPEGAALAALGLGAFLARHPLKLTLADAKRGRLFPRTRWALVFVGLYGGLAAVGAGFAIARARGRWWMPLALAAPPALAQLVADAWGRGRTLAAETLGAALPGALASSIALAAGWAIAPAFALWAILASRGLPAILHVRARLRADRGAAVDRWTVEAAHAVAWIVALALAAAELAPWTAAAVFGALLGRLLLERVARPGPVRPQILGVREMVLGGVSVLLIGIGYRLGV